MKRGSSSDFRNSRGILYFAHSQSKRWFSKKSMANTMMTMDAVNEMGGLVRGSPLMSPVTKAIGANKGFGLGKLVQGLDGKPGQLEEAGTPMSQCTTAPNTPMINGFSL